jgi:hypothetical protein
VSADPEADRISAVDKALSDWRQGDCVLGEHWFVHRVDPSVGLTDAARAAAEAGTDLAETAEVGLVVVTQTLDEDDFHTVERGRRPNSALVPALADRRLVADLDRTMTVEKSVVAGWQRVLGCRSDDETRRFASALARKRERFAFPDDFTALAKRLTARLADKHDRTTAEGHALRSLREIRVRADPSWDAQIIELMFWFVQDTGGDSVTGQKDHLSSWLGLLPAGGRFASVLGQVAALEDMTARDYVDSDPLDLDHLSSREHGGTEG